MSEKWQDASLEGIFKKFEENSRVEAHMLNKNDAPRMCYRCMKEQSNAKDVKNAVMEIKNGYLCMEHGLRYMEEYQAAKGEAGEKEFLN